MSAWNCFRYMIDWQHWIWSVLLRYPLFSTQSATYFNDQTAFPCIAYTSLPLVTAPSLACIWSDFEFDSSAAKNYTSIAISTKLVRTCLPRCGLTHFYSPFDVWIKIAKSGLWVSVCVCKLQVSSESSVFGCVCWEIRTHSALVPYGAAPLGGGATVAHINALSRSFPQIKCKILRHALSAVRQRSSFTFVF